MRKESKCLLTFMVTPHNKMYLHMVHQTTKTANIMNSVDYFLSLSVSTTLTSTSSNAAISSNLKRRTVLDQFSSINSTSLTAIQYKAPLDSIEEEE